jgi:hypothetical protein
VDILNPSDEVTVTLTTIDPPDTKMAIHARAEHVIVKDISNVRNASQIVDVMLESSTGTTWTLFKMLRLFVKD